MLPGKDETALIVSCSSCGARYRYDEARFEGKPSKKLRCTKCQTVFEIVNPAVGGAMSVNPAPIQRAESTYTRDPEAVPRPESRDGLIPVPESRVPETELRLPTDQRISVAVISGVDSGKTFAVSKPRMVIGRADCEIVLSDSEVSRNHVALEVEDDIVNLVDLGSTNGTFIGGERVATARLANYDEFEIGGTTLMVIYTSGA
jgi:predicted Zn finger-like uncharacterized protein